MARRIASTLALPALRLRDGASRASGAPRPTPAHRRARAAGRPRHEPPSRPGRGHGAAYREHARPPGTAPARWGLSGERGAATDACSRSRAIKGEAVYRARAKMNHKQIDKEAPREGA